MYTVPVEETEFMKKSGKVRLTFRRTKNSKWETLSNTHASNLFLPYYLDCNILFSYNKEGIENAQTIATGKMTKTENPSCGKGDIIVLSIQDIVFEKPFKADQKYFLFDVTLKELIRLAKEDINAHVITMDSEESILVDVGLDNHLPIRDVHMPLLVNKPRKEIKWVRGKRPVNKINKKPMSDKAFLTFMRRFTKIN